MMHNPEAAVLNKQDGMDITQLRAFITIAHTGNLTRAAQQLHLTQPAVSLQIKSLQRSLNLQLFIRTATGMILTDDGTKLLPLAQRILEAMAELRQSAQSLHSTLSGALAIGTILDPEFIRLGPPHSRHQARHDRISIGKPPRPERLSAIGAYQHVRGPPRQIRSAQPLDPGDPAW